MRNQAPRHAHMKQRSHFLSLLLFLLTPVLLLSQNVDYSIANEFRYGIGEWFQNDEAETKEYLETS